MSYGVNRWAATPTRVRRAGRKSRSKRVTRKAPRRSTASARRARKKRAPAKKRTTSRRKKKERLYTSYDPISGQKYRLPKSDPRYDTWPHRKPSKKAKAQARIAAITGLTPEEAAVAQAVATPVARRAVTVGRRVATKIGGAAAAATVAAGQTAGLGALSTASLVLITGLASYYATKSLQEHYVSEDERKAREADNYRAARQAFEQQTGRRPNNAENAALAQKFKAAIAAGREVQQTGRFGRI